MKKEKVREIALEIIERMPYANRDILMCLLPKEADEYTKLEVIGDIMMKISM